MFTVDKPVTQTALTTVKNTSMIWTGTFCDFGNINRITPTTITIPKLSIKMREGLILFILYSLEDRKNRITFERNKNIWLIDKNNKAVSWVPKSLLCK